MTEFPGAGGLILNEPLLWEQGRKGRSGYSLPRPDVPAAALPAALTGEGPDFPDLSEAEVVRHYTRLSQWNFSVEGGDMAIWNKSARHSLKVLVADLATIVEVPADGAYVIALVIEGCFAEPVQPTDEAVYGRSDLLRPGESHVG